ncbi:MAG: hypothetical protein PWP37_58 [Thermotogota bacterium]|nr:hypothetical protein [Thermotogota bacterium]MDK2863866.1 hypothetical protein [Thermotogota bacterium]HCZ07135.1 hypothetical protein [Thermotogota bacterium]
MTLTLVLSGVYLISCYIGQGIESLWKTLPLVLVAVIAIFLSKSYLWPENTLKVTLVVGTALSLLSRFGGKLVDPDRTLLAVSLAVAVMGVYNLVLSRRLRMSTFAAYLASWVFVEEIMRNILLSRLNPYTSALLAIVLAILLGFREFFQLKRFFSQKVGGESENG